jgi:hypothetical protein
MSQACVFLSRWNLHTKMEFLHSWLTNWCQGKFSPNTCNLRIYNTTLLASRYYALTFLCKPLVSLSKHHHYYRRGSYLASWLSDGKFQFKFSVWWLIRTSTRWTLLALINKRLMDFPQLSILSYHWATRSWSGPLGFHTCKTTNESLLINVGNQWNFHSVHN